MKLRIGTRGSKLALWQTQHVADKLRQGGVESEIVVISTRGDKQQDVTIAEIGTRGVFTEEIEEQLRKKTIDLAVHSAKDLQSSLPEEFEIAAFMEREQTADVLVSHQPDFSLRSDHSLIVGTSSVRRKALLNHYFPHIETVEMRGNLQTRFAKMEAGECDALMLAYAGVHRMKYDRSIVHQFSTEEMIPAVGQGSVAVEVLATIDSEKRKTIRQQLNHGTTEQQLQAERAYLKRLRGGCSVPVFALASITGDNLLLQGGVVSLDGKTLLRDQITGSRSCPQEAGERLADKIISQGGNQILESIRRK